ncbi:quercetin dioxygenase-like cupin family protein [Paenibacillus amylolyticus]|uniref:Quercetin dioxygenase-like cupin family protein n=1 Tax=Paenibacillus amylolyticus TaxID=1451 RepID=A0AAP5H0B2_PAEAM|nr:cupin domain-containing protein [Paenibacillus amylolyticus]MDR6722636.1 quercetin dioxygenase-like cupin family protein [Paenibacillus amylolyticus]
MILENAAISAQVINATSSRKILGMGGTLMMVEVSFAKGGIGEVHSHDQHEQVSYIVKGSFEVQVGEETRILRAGDSFYAGYNVPHGVKALEDSIILDVFTPFREDFIEEPQ